MQGMGWAFIGVYLRTTDNVAPDTRSFRCKKPLDLKEESVLKGPAQRCKVNAGDPAIREASAIHNRVHLGTVYLFRGPVYLSRGRKPEQVVRNTQVWNAGDT